MILLSLIAASNLKSHHRFWQLLDAWMEEVFHTKAWQCCAVTLLPLMKVELDGLDVIQQLQDLTRRESLGNETFQTLLEQCILTVFLMGATDSLNPFPAHVITDRDKGQGNIICMFSLINFNPTISLF